MQPGAAALIHQTKFLANGKVLALGTTLLHCLVRHAVPIEPGLPSLSPENGNISNIRRRLLAISLPQRPISEPGDR
jgi:hypothetical protein